MLPRISKIINVTPFKVTCLWNTGENKTIDFKKFQKENSLKIMDRLLVEDVFNKVQLNEITKTLSWSNMIEGKDEKNNPILGELDFCPDVLYKISEN